jgi:uncharacterized membrane protein
MKRTVALLVAIVAVMTAVTTVLTVLVQIPSPIRGYFNLSDVAIFFTAFALGPFAAAIAGGLGTALADVATGYAQFAPITLLAHGVEGLLAGLIAGLAARPERQGTGTVLAWIGAGVVGVAAMVALYLAGGWVLQGAAALTEVPGNAIQAGVGAVLGAGLAGLVYRAYPPVRDLRW